MPQGQYQKNFHKLTKQELSDLIRKKFNNYDFDYYYKDTTLKDIKAFVNALPENKKYCFYDRREKVMDNKIDTKRGEEKVTHKNLFSFEFAKVRNNGYTKRASIHIYAITEFPIEEDVANIKTMMA